MTTDITELAQSEINDALAQLKQISEYPTPSTQYARVLRKYILALVEALEKAQQRIAELDIKNCELDSLTQRWAVERAENADRIAELESRAVTVENLQESAYRAGLTAGWNLGMANNNDGFNKCLAAHAAGIKVEAE
ncbi:hypothetical protein FKL55_14835 [Klebsiella pneumoniae]|nr:hypothetical protein [Klebsiella pneumoniae]